MTRRRSAQSLPPYLLGLGRKASALYTDAGRNIICTVSTLLHILHITSCTDTVESVQDHLLRASTRTLGVGYLSLAGTTSRLTSHGNCLWTIVKGLRGRLSTLKVCLQTPGLLGVGCFSLCLQESQWSLAAFCCDKSHLFFQSCRNSLGWPSDSTR